MAKMLNAIPTRNEKLVKWVNEWVEICKPDAVYWCDGSREEYDRLCNELVESGLAIRLNPAKRPNSLLFRSDPSDVARVEARTFIASEKQEDAGPTNNWIDPKELKKTMLGLYDGCMKVVPSTSFRSRWARSDRTLRRSASSSRTRPTL